MRMSMTRGETADPEHFGSSQRGGLVKGGLAIYVFPWRNCNTLGSVFNVQIENMPNC